MEHDDREKKLFLEPLFAVKNWIVNIRPGCFGAAELKMGRKAKLLGMVDV